MTHSWERVSQTYGQWEADYIVLVVRRFIADVQNVIWTIIIGICVVDCILSEVEVITIVLPWGMVIFVMALFALSVVIQRRNPPAARLLGAFAQIFAFAFAGSALPYLAMAAAPFLMADRLLDRADAALGFDWLAWFTWVKAHATLHFLLAIAYSSIPFQVLGLLLYFCYVDSRRVDELLLATVLSAFIMVPGMVVLPAVGAWSHYGVGIEPWRAGILGLRSHTLLTVGTMQGIVSFPSFHATLGVLLANAARGRKWFLLTLFLSLLLIASVMTEGAHYAMDILGGLAVAWVAIAASRSILKRCSRNSAELQWLHTTRSKQAVADLTTGSEIPLSGRL